MARLLLLGLFGFACLFASACAANRPPNIIVVLIDDMGAMDLGCQGSLYFKTPNIDRLASRGVRFTQGYAACAVCSPTRAAILTGQYPSRLGITDWIRGDYVKDRRPAELVELPGYTGEPHQRLACPANVHQLPHEAVTLAERLQSRGYATGYIGKWHLGDEGFLPTEQGFDINYGGYGYGQPPSYFDPYSTRKLPRGIPTLVPRSRGEYLTDREAAEAVRFIEQNKDQPFYLHLAHHAVHTPIQAKPELIGPYRQPDQSEQNAAYAAMVQSVDEAMGRVLQTLEALDLTHRTVIVFTSDNGGLDQDGQPTDNAPLRSGKGFPYEGGLRVPFILSWPGVTEAGTTSAVPVISMDVFATALDAAGLSSDGPALDGVSLARLLHRPPESRTLYWYFPHYRYNDVGPYAVVREGNAKLIHYFDTEKTELYNLADDPREQHDVSSEQADKVRELSAKLKTWMRETNARELKSNPIYGGR